MLALCGTLHSLVWSTLPVDDGTDEDNEWDDVLVQDWMGRMIGCEYVFVQMDFLSNRIYRYSSSLDSVW